MGKVKAIEGKGSKQVAVIEYSENGVTKTAKTPLKDTKFVSIKQVEKPVEKNAGTSGAGGVSNIALSQPQKYSWSQDVFSSTPEVVSFRTQYQQGTLLAKEENRYIEYFGTGENNTKVFARIKSMGKDGKLELEFLDGGQSKWVDPTKLEGAQTSTSAKKYFAQAEASVEQENMLGSRTNLKPKLTPDGKQMYVNPSNTQTKVGKDGFLGMGKNVTIDAKSKTIPYTNPNDVVVENGNVVRDIKGTGGQVTGTQTSPIKRIAPSNNTQLGQYAKAMDKKGTVVYSQDEKYIGSAGYSAEAKVVGTTAKEETGKVIALNAQTDNLVFRQRTMNHEGFHNEVKVKIEKGDDTPWGSSFKVVNGRKTLYAGSRDNILVGYNRRLAPEEMNTYGKDFMSSTVIAHNRETSQAIDAAMTKMPSTLTSEQKLANIRVSYKTVVDDAAYRKELEMFRDMAGDAEANLKPFADKLEKLKAGDASAISFAKSPDGKSLILTADNIEYHIPAKGVPPSDYAKFAEDHINRILEIKSRSMKVTDEIENLIETAKKQNYFDGNQYRRLKDKMAELTNELNGTPRVLNSERLETVEAGTFNPNQVAKNIQNNPKQLSKVEDYSVSVYEEKGQNYFVRTQQDVTDLPADKGLEKYGYDVTTHPKRDVQAYKTAQTIGYKNAPETQLAQINGKEASIQKGVEGRQFKNPKDFQHGLWAQYGKDPYQVKEVKQQLEDLAVYDMVIGNRDRNPTNIFWNPKIRKIIPIDSGDSMPTHIRLEEPQWFWSRKMGLSHPMEPETRAKILALDENAIAKQMQADGLVEQSAIDLMKERVRLMKQYVKMHPDGNITDLSDPISRSIGRFPPPASFYDE